MTMNDPVIPVTMHLPKSVVERFKRKAVELIPEEREEAPSLLLTLFINYMSSDDYWCLFLPDLTREDYKKWQEMANQVYDSMYETVKYHGAGMFPGEIADLAQAVVAARRMTPDDLIKLIIISARYNQVMWKRNDSNKDSSAPSQ
jgi:hypothetical protein